MLLLVVLLAACAQPTPAPVPEKECPTAQPCPSCPTCPTPEPAVAPVVQEVPFQDLWAGSGHNDTEAMAFNDWNEADPKEVPANCAKCHTTPGYQDFLGTDGSEAGKVDKPVPAPAGTIQCVACHNAAAAALDSVTFPSGLTVEHTGSTSRCMECHQGRASKAAVDKKIADYKATALDTVPAPVKNDQGKDVPMGFVNIHYYAAGATLYGTQAKGGYEYDGYAYDGKFRPVEGIESCGGCHDSHSLEVMVESCKECHENVNAVEDLRNVRMQGSLADYDGDGDVEESIDSELTGLQETLYGALQTYAKDVAGAAIAYNAEAYPYFFTDTNGDGTADESEAKSENAYKTWTPRLLKAAYNYQTTIKDTGAFAHNAKYMIELLYDSIEDLNAKLGSIDMKAMHRDDPGHFAGDTEAFRHWDAEGEVEAGCVKCHSSEGLPMFLENGATIAVEPSNGFMCTTCHTGEEFPARYSVASVVFPSGKEVSFGGKDADGKFVADESNLCIECHQGRSSTPNVNKALGDREANTPDKTIRFTNIHYFAAGATIFGTEVQGAYEFADKQYNGLTSHPVNKCADCHDVHALSLNMTACAACHGAASDPQDPATYRMDQTDYDGDGDVKEGIKSEIDTFAERLYAAIQAYATDKGTGIVYDAHSYPYFLLDADGDGQGDKNDQGGLVGYNAFTPTLLKAAYNYQYYQKDPGAFTHNSKYVLQFLYDSIEAVGGDTTGLTRPAAAAPAP